MKFTLLGTIFLSGIALSGCDFGYGVRQESVSFPEIASPNCVETAIKSVKSVEYRGVDYCDPKKWYAGCQHEVFTFNYGIKGLPGYTYLQIADGKFENIFMRLNRHVSDDEKKIARDSIESINKAVKRECRIDFQIKEVGF